MSSSLSPDAESVRSFNPPQRNGKHSQVKGTVGQGDHLALLEDLYEQWQLDPNAVDPTWRSFFEGFELGCQVKPKTSKESSEKKSSASSDLPEPTSLPHTLKQARIYNLLFAYRTLGHRAAHLDPLSLEKEGIDELNFDQFNFTEEDKNTFFHSGTLAGGGERRLSEIVDILHETYCRTIGAEYMHIQDFTIRRWLRDKMEKCRNRPNFSKEKKKRILNRILAAEQFERYLHTRFVGQKRFSIEGGETLIPMLDALIEGCPERGISQVVMGMAHRGRLNVLANILGKDYHNIFHEFSDNFIPELKLGDGDVKYHLGFDAKLTTSHGQNVGISLAPNPSHLEAVDPVVQGKTRAWQRILDDTSERRKVLPVLLHGDAAFIGQGIVAETFNFSRLDGYSTGGTVHIVINNQIGFTTVPKDSRSAQYCTALAKSIGVPVFHINGDDPVSAVYLIELAMDFRQRFQRDVVIDLVCYRRHGHNEGDEPNFTQPTLYSTIGSHPLVSETYMRSLIETGIIKPAEAENYKETFQKQLNNELALAKKESQEITPELRQPISNPKLIEPIETLCPIDELKRIGQLVTRDPEKVKINNKLKKWLENRRNMMEGKTPLDWSLAETLAFATILEHDRVPIRLSGQDSRRGTFSQRHSVFYDVNTRERYIALKNITPDQATFCVYNSPLSEAAVLGFDFGYSLDYPKMLCIWEAQFGDFANGAQTIIDQYIVSSESKWGVTSGIVMLLPHGYHGQGPEHSSARLERFLQMCAEDNMQVANCSTPASYFHILRRQALRQKSANTRRPLIIMTPKGLLRDKRCTSTMEDLCQSNFEEIIPDSSIQQGAERIIFCSGKVYYDLDDYRKAQNITNTAIIRLEQLYPLHEEKLMAAAQPHLQSCQQIIWCQEESHNMGSWFFVQPRLSKIFNRDIKYAGRDASASPATGSLAIHELEQKDLINQAFTL
ncbi:MAG: 2-oxoglutarate dehydrogenase E1 component [Verrucomicrobiota bacterium]